MEQVTAPASGARHPLWLLSVGLGFLLKPRGLCLQSWGLMGPPWGAWWGTFLWLWGVSGLQEALNTSVTPECSASGGPWPSLPAPASPSWRVWEAGPVAPSVQEASRGGLVEEPVGVPSGLGWGGAPPQWAPGSLAVSVSWLVGRLDRPAAWRGSPGEMVPPGGGGVAEVGDPPRLSFLEFSSIRSMLPLGLPPPWAGPESLVRPGWPVGGSPGRPLCSGGLVAGAGGASGAAGAWMQLAPAGGAWPEQAGRCWGLLSSPLAPGYSWSRSRAGGAGLLLVRSSCVLRPGLATCPCVPSSGLFWVCATDKTGTEGSPAGEVGLGMGHSASQRPATALPPSGTTPAGPASAAPGPAWPVVRLAGLSGIPQ